MEHRGQPAVPLALQFYPLVHDIFFGICAEAGFDAMRVRPVQRQRRLTADCPMSSSIRFIGTQCRRNTDRYLQLPGSAVRTQSPRAGFGTTKVPNNQSQKVSARPKFSVPVFRRDTVMELVVVGADEYSHSANDHMKISCAYGARNPSSARHCG